MLGRALALRSVGLAVLLAIRSVAAQTLDQPSADALGDTLRMLESRPGTTRSPLGGSPEIDRELYDVAGQVFRELTERAGGDVGEMNRALDRGRADPAAFAASLSPATRERLRALARRLDAERR